jgi:hypothetical protein
MDVARLFAFLPSSCVQLTHKNLFVVKSIRRQLMTIDSGEQKQKYSNAIEKQSSSRSNSVTMNGVGYLGIRKDMSVKNLVSTASDA